MFSSYGTCSQWLKLSGAPWIGTLLFTAGWLESASSLYPIRPRLRPGLSTYKEVICPSLKNTSPEATSRTHSKARISR